MNQREQDRRSKEMVGKDREVEKRGGSIRNEEVRERREEVREKMK